MDIDPIRKAPIEWTTQIVWALAAGGPAQPGTLWAGTAPGGLFRSDDSGQSWQLQRGLWDLPDRKRWSGGGLDWPAIHSINVDPRNADHLTIAVSTGGVWKTRDGGRTWAVGGPGLRNEYLPPDQALDPVPQDVHRMIACAAAPEVLWAQHHNGIFRSTDGAASWTEITSAARPSGFGFTVAVHPRDPKTAWFVPAIKDEKRMAVDGRVVVSRTRDGGQTFDVLSRGLPQGWAYDLVYRHALDVDATGARLMFGSTTGNVWVSEDGGDGWQALSSNLPPINFVQFTG